MSTPLQGGDDNAVTSQASSATVFAGGFGLGAPDGFFERQTRSERRQQLIIYGGLAVLLIAGALLLRGRKG